MSLSSKKIRETSSKGIRELLELGIIAVEPLPDINSQLGNSSIDLRLSPRFREQKAGNYIIRLAEGQSIDDYTHLIERPDGYLLHPKRFVLGETIERVKLPPHIFARLDTRSRYVQVGIQTNATSGLVHAGHEGPFKLEIFNCGDKPVHLVPGERICQISFYPTRLFLDTL